MEKRKGKLPREILFMRTPIPRFVKSQQQYLFHLQHIHRVNFRGKIWKSVVSLARFDVGTKNISSEQKNICLNFLIPGRYILKFLTERKG